MTTKVIVQTGTLLRMNMGGDTMEDTGIQSSRISHSTKKFIKLELTESTISGL